MGQIPISKSTRTSYFHRDLHTIHIDLYLQMRRYLLAITVIPTLIGQHWFEIAHERFNSSVGTNTYKKGTPNSSPFPMTRLLL
jgi:hypothetical protein